MTSDGFPHQDGSGLARLGHDGQVRPGLRHACLKGSSVHLPLGGFAPGHEHGACGKRWTAPCWAITVRVHSVAPAQAATGGASGEGDARRGRARAGVMYRCVAHPQVVRARSPRRSRREWCPAGGASVPPCALGDPGFASESVVMVESSVCVCRVGSVRRAACGRGGD